MTGILAFAPFERGGDARALEVTPEAAGRALGELVDYCLLRPDDHYQVAHALELLEQARRDARQGDDPRVEAGALGALGTVCARMGNPRRAVTLYKQQLAIARQLQDAAGTCAALGNLGAAYKDLGQTRQAVKFFQKALDLTRELGDRPWEDATLDNAEVHLGLHNFAGAGQRGEAIGLAQQALAAYDTLDHPKAAEVRSRLDEWLGSRTG